MKGQDWIVNGIAGMVTLGGVSEWLPDLLAGLGGLSLLVYNGYGIIIRHNQLKEGKEQ